MSYALIYMQLPLKDFNILACIFLHLLVKMTNLNGEVTIHVYIYLYHSSVRFMHLDFLEQHTENISQLYIKELIYLSNFSIQPLSTTLLSLSGQIKHFAINQ